MVDWVLNEHFNFRLSHYSILNDLVASVGLYQRYIFYGVMVKYVSSLKVKIQRLINERVKIQALLFWVQARGLACCVRLPDHHVITDGLTIEIKTLHRRFLKIPLNPLWITKFSSDLPERS